MANTIKLKRGSGSDPQASDLSVGEIAIRTDSGKLFTKKDNGAVAEISGSGGIDDGDKGDITVSNGGDTFTIDSGVVTSAKIADGTIVNADINASAAIAGTKISPDFGSQNIATTGGMLIGDTTSMSSIAGQGVLEIARPSGPEIVLRRDDTSISSNNSLGRIEVMGNDPNGNEERVGGVISFSCPNGRTWSADDYPTNISFSTCKDGSGTRTTSLFLNAALGNKKHNVLVGGASGSNMDDYYLGIRGNENT